MADLFIHLNLNTVEQSRSIYSFFDFLGDVGGLLDLFVLFAELLVSVVAWIFGSNFDSYLIANLFKTVTQKKRNDTIRSNDYRDAGLK